VRTILVLRNEKGFAVERPASYPVAFKEFLRIVVGGTIASARTETDRLHYYRRFLRDTAYWFESYPAALCKGEPVTPASIPEPDADKVADIIARDRNEPFTEPQFKLFAEFFLLWAKQLPRARAVRAAAARHQKTLLTGQSKRPNCHKQGKKLSKQGKRLIKHRQRLI
jgi:hypothetical protein